MNSEIESIEQLIPHRAPFIMVDKVISFTHEKSTTSFFIEEDNVLCENNSFRETGLIENIAQSVAASRGYEGRKNNTSPKIGYIGSIKSFKVNFFPSVNSEITTEITLLNQVLNFTSIEGKVFQNGQLVAEAELVIAIQS